MAIKGVIRWDNPDCYYSQQNNAIEAILRKKQAHGWLETCGSTAATMLVDAIGGSVKAMTPGGYSPQPEDVLTLWLNDPRNTAIMQGRRPEISPNDYLGNEIPQFYSVAIPAVFGVEAVFSFGCTVQNIKNAIDNKLGVMIAMKSPGHFIAVIAYDDETDEIIYHDPWAGNNWPMRYSGKDGRWRRLTVDEFYKNIQPYRVEIG